MSWSCVTESDAKPINSLLHRRNYNGLFDSILHRKSLLQDEEFVLRLIGRGDVAIPHGLHGKVVKEPDLPYPVSMIQQPVMFSLLSGLNFFQHACTLDIVGHMRVWTYLGYRDVCVRHRNTTGQCRKQWRCCQLLLQTSTTNPRHLPRLQQPSPVALHCWLIKSC